MKDLLGREVQIGNYICYALTAGRSANLAVYQVKEVLDNKIKAVKIDSSYGSYSYDWNVPTVDCKNAPSKEIPRKYAKWSSNLGGYTEMTPEEKFKVDCYVQHNTFGKGITAYRVAHVQAVDNFDYYVENEIHNLGAWMQTTFNVCIPLYNRDEALHYAQTLLATLSYCEYGIVELDASEYNFPGC